MNYGTYKNIARFKYVFIYFDSALSRNSYSHRLHLIQAHIFFWDIKIHDNRTESLCHL